MLDEVRRILDTATQNLYNYADFAATYPATAVSKFRKDFRPKYVSIDQNGIGY